ncbi:MAG: hypothetical protein U0441_32060 [Polyangiaceae bacterium]
MAQDTNASPRKGLLIAAAATALTLAGGVTAGSLLGYVGPDRGAATATLDEAAAPRDGASARSDSPPVGPRETVERGRSEAAPQPTEARVDAASADSPDPQAFQEPTRAGRDHDGRERGGRDHHGRDHAEHERAEHERGDDDDD